MMSLRERAQAWRSSGSRSSVISRRSGARAWRCRRKKFSGVGSASYICNSRLTSAATAWLRRLEVKRQWSSRKTSVMMSWKIAAGTMMISAVRQ
ncbi:MAG: hypothetical protein DCF16_11965 [Alphaproteobacteria bacterium]|nr:MAG: hypothetical protein DCF16_11965 [Alphaproteobacteria bacterium]